MIDREKELIVKSLEKLILFLSCENGTDNFFCITVDIPEAKIEDFEKKWKDINKSGKSYIGRVKLVTNPNGTDKNGNPFNRRLPLHIYSEDYVKWAKKKIMKLNEVSND